MQTNKQLERQAILLFTGFRNLLQVYHWCVLAQNLVLH